MDIDSKIPEFSGKNIIIVLLSILILSIPIEVLKPNLKNPEQGFVLSGTQITEKTLIITQKNTLVSISNPLVIQKPKAKIIQESEPRVINRIKMIITAYSSTPDQTDSTPFITASNSWVRKGIVANNWFPFGTRIKIPELFGDKIFVVEDRMHQRKGNYHVDIWFSSREEAINFGVERAYIEVLED
jgi:3D (Asp-Asp-Asp) domain-containing protein